MLFHIVLLDTKIFRNITPLHKDYLYKDTTLKPKQALKIQ
jgi:hypothetical protein